MITISFKKTKLTDKVNVLPTIVATTYPGNTEVFIGFLKRGLTITIFRPI